MLLLPVSDMLVSILDEIAKRKGVPIEDVIYEYIDEGVAKERNKLSPKRMCGKDGEQRAVLDAYIFPPLDGGMGSGFDKTV